MPATPETHESAQSRLRKETLKDHVRRIEGGEPLGLADLPHDIVQDMSKALTDGRMASLLAPVTPWWMLHPFGNVSSLEPPEKAARSAAAGASVDETRAELAHNGGHSVWHGWQPEEPPAAAVTGASDRWGLLWAQDCEQLVVSFPLPSSMVAAYILVELREGGRRLIARAVSHWLTLVCVPAESLRETLMYAPRVVRHRVMLRCGPGRVLPT